MDWNAWLADIGDQNREPRRSEPDVDMRSYHAEVSYRVVCEDDEDPLSTIDGSYQIHRIFVCIYVNTI